MPEMLRTAWGSLSRSLRVEPGERAADPGRHHLGRAGRGGDCQAHGAFVAATTRQTGREKLLRANDDAARFPALCQATRHRLQDAMVGSKWSIEDFSPMDAIPSTVCLTTYNGGPLEFMAPLLNDLTSQVAAGTLRVQVGRTFQIDEIIAAHRCLEENKARGKIVVLS